MHELLEAQINIVRQLTLYQLLKAQINIVRQLTRSSITRSSTQHCMTANTFINYWKLKSTLCDSEPLHQLLDAEINIVRQLTIA